MRKDKEKYPISEGWPSRRQELLLKAALLDSDEAVEMWRQWVSLVDFRDLQINSRFILPLAYHNLLRRRAEIEPSALQYLRKLYLNTHGQNVKRFRLLPRLVESFDKAGLQTTLLKGSALMLLYYKKFGLRPMSDLDILIPAEKLDTALDLLRNLGWRPKPRAPERLTKSYFKTVHGYEFINHDGQSLDLHWHVLHECRYSEADDDLWQGAATLDYKGVCVYTLNPAVQLLHICVQGARCEGVTYLRWAADAVTVMRNAENDIDWNRLVYLSKKHMLILPLRDVLTYINERLGIAVPHAVLEELHNAPVTRLKTFEYHYKRQRFDHKLLGYWPIWWFDFSRQGNKKNFIRKVIEFPKYIANYWGTENLGQFVNFFSTIIFNKIERLAQRKK